MQETGTAEKRYSIDYIEGVNALSSFNVAKKTELRHAENARSTQIGSIEKRGGQIVIGGSQESDCWGPSEVNDVDFGVAYSVEGTGIASVDHIQIKIEHTGVGSPVTATPGTVADSATVGTVAWSDPNNAKVSDGSYATADLSGSSSLIDSYSETNSNTSDTVGWNTGTADIIGVGQAFKGDGKAIDYSQFYLKKNGTPAGYAYSKIYNPSSTGDSFSTNSPSTMADDAAMGTVAWSNVDNGKLSDNVYSTATLSGSPVIVDSYNESNQDVGNILFGLGIPSAPYDVLGSQIGDTRVGQSFQGKGNILTSAKFYAYRIGSPVGNCYAKIFAHSGVVGDPPTGVALATSDAVDVNTIPGTGIFPGGPQPYALIPFTFSGANKIVLENGSYYVVAIEFTGGNSVDRISIGFDFSSSTHSGTRCTYKDGVWMSWGPAVTGGSTIFYVYGTPVSHYLKATNLGFAIPTGSTINGIKVEVEQKSTVDTYESAVRIVKSSGAIGTTNRATGGTVSSVDNYVSYGGATDTWGETWTVSDINNSNFGAVFSSVGDGGVTSVDHMRITVYYTGDLGYGVSDKPYGDPIAVSNAFDVSTITGSFSLKDFSFSGINKVTLTDGQPYIVTFEYDNGDAANNISVGYDSTSPTHLGNKSTYHDLMWNAESANDAVFYVYADSTTKVSHYLKATNFGFAIPSTATITKITVGIEQSATDSVNENIIKLVQADGTLDSVNIATGTFLPPFDGLVSYIVIDNLCNGTLSDFVVTGNYGLFYYVPTNPTTNQYLYRISEVAGAGTATIYYLNSSGIWTALIGNGTEIIMGQFDYTPAENCMFLVNHEDNNRYISTDGTTVYDSSTAAGHLVNSPRAHRCNFYKGRLYVANYTLETPSSIYDLSGGTNYVTITNLPTTGGSGTGMTIDITTSIGGVMASVTNFRNIGSGYREGDTITVTNGGGVAATFKLHTTRTDYLTSVARSSYPMGLVALINEDVDAAATIIPKVTDTKYFYNIPGADIYDVYRGPNYITTLTVTTIDEYTITATMGNVVDLKASDQIWISGTYKGDKIMRWPKNPTAIGKDVKQYDTFKLAGGDNDGITMLTNVGNILMIANKSSMSSWNDYTLENFDLGIGNVSKNGYVKLLGSLYFMHYTGIYTTSGGAPKLISNKIERYITGATKTGLEECAAGKKGRSVFFAVGDVTLYYPDGSPEKVLSDVCFEYNLTQENWFIHTNVKASEFATFVSNVGVSVTIPTPSDRLILTDNDGTGDMATKEFLVGNTDDGIEIPFRIDFNRMTLNPYFERINSPIALLLDTERGSSMKVFVSVIEGNPEWYEIDGDVEKGLSIVKITAKDDVHGLPPPCRLLDVSIRDASEQSCRVNRATVSFLPSNQDSVES